MVDTITGKFVTLEEYNTLAHKLEVATGRVGHKDGGFSSPAIAYAKNAVRRLRPVVIMGAADMEPSPEGYVSHVDYDWLVDQFEAVKVQLDMAHAKHIENEKATVGQIARLAEFIMMNVPGEPSQSQSAVDTAIRIMGEQQSEITKLKAHISAITSELNKTTDESARLAKEYRERLFSLGKLLNVVQSLGSEASIWKVIEGQIKSLTAILNERTRELDIVKSNNRELTEANKNLSDMVDSLRRSNSQLADAAVMQEPADRLPFAVSSTVGEVTQTQFFEPISVDEPKERAVFECSFEYAREHRVQVISALALADNGGNGYIKVVAQSE